MDNILSKNGRNSTRILQVMRETRKRENKFYTVAVANQKGGVSKTTTSISLGGALVNYKKDVLLVDLDPQANLTLALGFDPKNIKRTVTDVFMENFPVEMVVRESAIPGLYFLPSNNGMGMVERAFVNHSNPESVLQRAFNALRDSALNSFDYIILDCPPSIDIVTINALVVAQLLIIPTQPEYFSVNALRTMMSLIQSVRTKHNQDLVYRILITMLDRRNKIHQTLSEQIRLTFRQGLFHTMISTDTKLRESTIYGLPITFYQQKTRSAIQYSALAQELITYVSEKAPYAL